MKRLMTYLSALFLLVVMASCNGRNNTPEPDQAKDKVLVSYPWRLEKVTDETNKDIPQNQLGLATSAIFYFDIQFFDNNVTKALDQVSRQVVNGGTWYLIENDKVLDIEVSQFKGKFGVVELTGNKMILKNKIPVNGVEKEAHMVFKPVVQ